MKMKSMLIGAAVALTWCIGPQALAQDNDFEVTLEVFDDDSQVEGFLLSLEDDHEFDGREERESDVADGVDGERRDGEPRDGDRFVDEGRQRDLEQELEHDELERDFVAEHDEEGAIEDHDVIEERDFVEERDLIKEPENDLERDIVVETTHELGDDARSDVAELADDNEIDAESFDVEANGELEELAQEEQLADDELVEELALEESAGDEV